MASRRVKLIYPPQLVDQPILYELGRKFNVGTNIRQADINDGMGWLVVEMRADEPVLDQAMNWLRELGIEIQPIAG